MMFFVSHFGILFLCSVVASLLAFGVKKWERTNESFDIAVATLFIVIAGGVPGLFFATESMARISGIFGALMGLCLSLMIYFPPIAIACSHFLDLFSDSTVTGLFLSGLSSPAPGQYGKARKKAMEDDLEGALIEFQRYHRENPKDPRPLLAAVRMFEKRGRFEDCANVWRDILRIYRDNEIVWAEAALRLADLLEQKCDDPKAAQYLLHEIQRRAPQSKQGRLATERLYERGKRKSSKPNNVTR